MYNALILFLLPDKGKLEAPVFLLQPPASSERNGEEDGGLGNVAQQGWGESKAVRVEPVIE
jgi:hypothetical protein